MRIEPSVQMDRLPRMARLAIWGEAVCRAAGEPTGAFLRAYRVNREEAAAILLESSTVAGAVLELASQQARWEGEANELMAVLSAFVGRGRGEAGPATGPRPPGTGRGAATDRPRAPDAGVSVEFRREPSNARRRVIVIRQRTGRGCR